MEENKIKKDSFVYKVAYGMTTFPPLQINHCRFWKRFILMLVIVWPVIILTLGIGITIGFIITLPFAVRPAIFKEESREFFIPYKKWPRIKGHLLRPIYFLLLFGLYYFQSLFLALFTLITTNIGLSIIGVIAGIILLIYSFKLLSKTEAYQLTQDYPKAKKQGICPIITFVDPPAETTVEE